MDPAPPELVALLAACRARPADDLPRLVLADWLDENNQPERAEFVRVQVELSHPTADAKRTAELKGVEQRLLTAHVAGWMAGYERAMNALRDQDQAPGHVVTIHTQSYPTANRFTRGLFRFWDVTGYHNHPELLAWLRMPEAEWLEQVGLMFTSIEGFVKADLADELHGRIGLNLRAGTVPEVGWSQACRLLAVSSNFAAVRTLHVMGLPGDVFMEEVSRADVGGLVGLSLGGGLVGWALDGGDVTRAANLIATAPFTALSSLDLGPLPEPALRALLRSPYLGNLTELNLVGSPIGDAGMVALCGSKLAHTLRAVEFPNTGIGDAGVVALARSPLVAQMHGPKLNLAWNHIGDAGLTALAECEHLLRFRELVFRSGGDPKEEHQQNRVADEGVIALAESPFAANLQYLDFWRNRITDRGAFALARSPHLNKVVDLSLKENAVTAAGAAALHARFGEAAKV